MLIVSTCQLRDPVIFFIFVVSDNRMFHVWMSVFSGLPSARTSACACYASFLPTWLNRIFLSCRKLLFEVSNYINRFVHPSNITGFTLYPQARDLIFATTRY